MLNTVSTDDAFVNRHVTLVAPRVAGQIATILVDDNNRVHKGDVLAGFTVRTGSTLALLPPENATGNFVKVVQRLPLRIEPVCCDAEQAPLFIGTSVVPVIYIKQPPTGPDAGKFLQGYVPQSSTLNPTASASSATQ